MSNFSRSSGQLQVAGNEEMKTGRAGFNFKTLNFIFKTLPVPMSETPLWLSNHLVLPTPWDTYADGWRYQPGHKKCAFPPLFVSSELDDPRESLIAWPSFSPGHYFSEIHNHIHICLCTPHHENFFRASKRGTPCYSICSIISKSLYTLSHFEGSPVLKVT